MIMFIRFMSISFLRCSNNGYDNDEYNADKNNGNKNLDLTISPPHDSFKLTRILLKLIGMIPKRFRFLLKIFQLHLIIKHFSCTLTHRWSELYFIVELLIRRFSWRWRFCRCCAGFSTFLLFIAFFVYCVILMRT